MFFRNLKLYRTPSLSGAERRNLGAALRDQCGHFPAREPGPFEYIHVGFAPPHGNESAGLLYDRAGILLFTVTINEKVLPPSVVNAEVAKQVASASALAGRPLGGRARRKIRGEVLDTLLPKALVRPKRLSGYFDTHTGWVVLDAASNRAAEIVLTKLREAAGSFPAVPLAPIFPPRAMMTEWLSRNTTPDGLYLGDECQLKDPAGGATIICRHQELESGEVREHLKQGKQVFRLGLQLGDHLSFVLDDDLTVRKLRFLDAVLEKLDGMEHESQAAEFDARFSLMTSEIATLIAHLSSTFDLDEEE